MQLTRDARGCARGCDRKRTHGAVGSTGRRATRAARRPGPLLWGVAAPAVASAATGHPPFAALVFPEYADLSGVTVFSALGLWSALGLVSALGFVSALGRVSAFGVFSALGLFSAFGVFSAFC